MTKRRVVFTRRLSQSRRISKGVFQGMLLLIVLVLLLGAMPNWGHSRSGGYGPSGLLGAVLLVVLVPVIIGEIQISRF